MICPKCGLDQPDSIECAKCGIIVAKYKSQSNPPDQPLPPDSQPLQDDSFGQAAPDDAPGQALPQMYEPPPQGVQSGHSHGQSVSGKMSSFQGISADDRRRVEAQETTKRFIITMLAIGVVIMVVAAMMSFFKVYFNATKFELEVQAAAADLGNSTPKAIKSRLMKRAKKWGFEVKNDRIDISYSTAGGGDLAQTLLYASGLQTWGLDVKINFIAVGHAVGIPIERNMRSSAHIVVKAQAQEIRGWLRQADEDYVGGKQITDEEWEEGEDYDEEYYDEEYYDQ